MKSNDNLIKYLNENFPPCDIPDLLKKNSLYFKFADQFADKRTEEKGMMLNRVLNSVNMAVACNIFSDLNEMNIEYISFKGFVLSQLLYANLNERAWGDIDFWVEPQHFDNVYQYLLEKGFSMQEENGMSNPHHVVLASGKTVVELHRKILHPMLGIHEEFLLGNLQQCTINQHNITTFNETAGILHLIYHLYMDAYLASYDMYSAIMKKMIPKANRFLYRAYEIALFSEKYSGKIDWEAIEADLKRQKLRAIFGRMIFDIVEIFQEAFPDSFLDTVSRLDYVVENENDRICQYTIEAGQVGGIYCIDCILGRYIDDSWLIHQHDNIHIRIGDSFIVNEKEEETAGHRILSCEVHTEQVNEGIQLCFAVSDDDLYCSDAGNYDTMSSDGVHLILCGTRAYSYNSIFFFPKIINGQMSVVAVNVHNDMNTVIEKTDIRAELTQTACEYSISAVLTHKFIGINHLDPYFYMGFVISDCNRETMRRQRYIVLPKDNAQWFNPLYFAKIEMK